MSSGTPLRIHFIKLHSFGLSVPEDYLFASEELLIPLAAVYLSKLMRILSADQLMRIQNSQVTKDLLFTL